MTDLIFFSFLIQYFKMLTKLNWQPKKWDGNFQYEATAPGSDEEDEKLMMLPTDYALLGDKEFRAWVEKVSVSDSNLLLILCLSCFTIDSLSFDLNFRRVLIPTPPPPPPLSLFRLLLLQYAEDKDLFFEHFSSVFAKLIELGVYRDESGIAKHNKGDGKHSKAEYKSAPAKSDTPQGEGAGKDGEAKPLAEKNPRARL